MQKETKNKRANSKKAISLIVLVITVIVMVILAGAVIVTLNNSGIITRANTATRNMNTKTVEEMANVYWAEAYAAGNREAGPIETYVISHLTSAGVDVSGYDITVTTKGVEVTKLIGIKLNSSTIELSPEETATLTVTMNEVIGTPIWTVSDNTVATLSTTTGSSVTVTAVSGGTATVTATLGDYSKSCTITVIEPPHLVKNENEKYTMISYNGQNLGIGDTINYVATGTSYTGLWKIFGVNENGELLIMAGESPETATIGEDKNTSKSQSDWENIKTILDSVCVKYGNGTGASTTPARSVTVDDINKLTGYNPEHTGVYDPDKTATTGSPYMNGNIRPNIPYLGTKQYTSGTFYNESSWIIASTEYPVTVAQTNYGYSPSRLGSSSTEDEPGLKTIISQEKKIIDMIFKTLDGNTNASTYWLASNCVHLNDSAAIFQIHIIEDGRVGTDFSLTSYSGSSYSCSYGIRPLVALSSDVILTEGTTTDWVIN